VRKPLLPTPTYPVLPKREAKDQFYKTKMCPYFPRGRCRRGNECNYAHSKAELRPSPSLRKTRLCERWREGVCPLPASACPFAHGEEDLHSTEDYYKTDLCKFWKQGICTLGDRCRHAHGLHEVRDRRYRRTELEKRALAEKRPLKELILESRMTQLHSSDSSASPIAVNPVTGGVLVKKGSFSSTATPSPESTCCRRSRASSHPDIAMLPASAVQPLTGTPVPAVRVASPMSVAYVVPTSPKVSLTVPMLPLPAVCYSPVNVSHVPLHTPLERETTSPLTPVTQTRKSSDDMTTSPLVKLQMAEMGISVQTLKEAAPDHYED